MNRTVSAVVVSLLSATLSAQAAWSRLYPASSPPARAGGVLAGHEATGGTVLYGGSGASGFLSDCWVLEGETWSQFVGVTPPARTSTAMVYDSVRQRIVLFGGASVASGPFADTWEWDGASWAQRTSVVTPPARASHALAFDRQRGVTVLFGGFGSGSTIFDDIWEWDGANWVSRPHSGGPGARYGHQMAFDAVSGVVLVCGGVQPQVGIHNDTWAWDGVQWLQHQPATPPPHDLAMRTASDVDRGRVLLHGGDLGLFSWEWDGSEWSLLLQASPGPRSYPAMAYDASARRTVLFGGEVSGTELNDTWVFSTPLPASVESIGVGCAGTAGTPVLAAAPSSLPWLGDTHRNVVAGIAPGELGALFVSSFGSSVPVDLGLVGMPGCNLLVGLDVLEFGLAVGGEAEWQFVVPNDPVLAGVSIYQQAFPLDGAANPLGFSASNGVVVTTGIR